MTVLAMSVERVEDHPDADSLRVHQLRAGERTAQVVANLETVYAVGDVVAVALVGSTLQGNLSIRRVRLRGVDSFGMMLGRVEEAVGTDLSHLHEDPAAEASSGAERHAFVAWPSIEQLHHLRAHFAAQAETPPQVAYRAKVKLDGTNAGVQILRMQGAEDEVSVVAQSRTRLLSVEQDNYGFARWVDARRDGFAALAQDVATGEDRSLVTVFGEWVGPGVQRGVAVSKIPEKCFVVFAIQFGDPMRDAATLEVEPAAIEARVGAIDGVHVLPWVDLSVSLDFADPVALAAGAERINALVSDVEQCDPWVKGVFGIEGVGEGVVLYPDPKGAPLDRDLCSERMFKAKGEKHRVVRTKAPAQIDPEQAKSVAEFVELVVTDARLEQGVREACDGVFEMKRIGHFLKWIAGDVRKETSVELEAAGLTWKQVGKAVSAKAKSFYINGVRRID